MPDLTRTFTVAELEEMGAPFHLPGDVEVARKFVGMARWSRVYQLLFRLDGHVWSITYEVRATEHQDVISPFRYDPVPATAMEQRKVSITRWLPVEAA